MDRKRVMIVDDSVTMRRAAEHVFGATEVDVILAESAEHAMEEVARARPDLMFVDAMMPGVDGFQLLGKLRALEGGDSIPILLMVSAIEPDIERIESAAVDGYVFKP